MQHEIHERHAVYVVHMFHAVESVGTILVLLRLGPITRIAMFTSIAISSNEKTACPYCWILDHIRQRRFHHRHHTVDQRTRGKALPCA